VDALAWEFDVPELDTAGATPGTRAGVCIRVIGDATAVTGASAFPPSVVTGASVGATVRVAREMVPVTVPLRDCVVLATVPPSVVVAAVTVR
jgi:hypothetical protein